MNGCDRKLPSAAINCFSINLPAIAGAIALPPLSEIPTSRLLSENPRLANLVRLNVSAPIAIRSDAIRESIAPLSMSVKLLSLLNAESAEDERVRADWVRNVDRESLTLPFYCRSGNWLKHFNILDCGFY